MRLGQEHAVHGDTVGLGTVGAGRAEAAGAELVGLRRGAFAALLAGEEGAVLGARASRLRRDLTDGLVHAAARPDELSLADSVHARQVRPEGSTQLPALGAAQLQTARRRATCPDLRCILAVSVVAARVEAWRAAVGLAGAYGLLGASAFDAAGGGLVAGCGLAA